MREGALFSGQASIDLEDAPDGADGSAYPEDELQTGYEDAVRRAAEWYRSSLFGQTVEPDHSGGQEPDARHLGAGRDHADRGDRSRPFAGADPERIDGSRAEERRRHRSIRPPTQGQATGFRWPGSVFAAVAMVGAIRAERGNTEAISSRLAFGKRRTPA